MCNNVSYSDCDSKGWSIADSYTIIMTPQYRFENKKALVTGATQGKEAKNKL